MARRAEWVHRASEVLAALDALEAPTLDRQAIQALFDVSPRQALRILHRFAGHRAGQALLIGRLELKSKLEALTASSDDVLFEQRRHQNVAAELRRIASARNARRLTIAAPASPALTQMSPGIRLGEGKLEISYTSGEELLGRLLELAQAVADDPERFRQVTGSCKAL